MDEEQMTERVLNASTTRTCTSSGTPPGACINEREPYPLRMEAVLDRAAERGVVVEVNGNPERLDLKAEHVRHGAGARREAGGERGRPQCLRRSNHSFAVATARRGWARKADVLNTLPVDDFLRHLKTMRTPT